MVQAVELSLAKAYGANIPKHFVQMLNKMRREAEQCTMALHWLTQFGQEPLSEPRVQQSISPLDMAYAKHSAGRATAVAIDCAEQLFAFAEMTEAASGATANRPAAQGVPVLDTRKIDHALEMIGSSQFQHTLTAALSIEERIQRGLHEAGSALQHFASEAVDWLIPTLKTAQPDVYAQKIAQLMPRVQTAAKIDRVARRRFNETERCLARSMLHAPRAIDAASGAQRTANKQLVYRLQDESNVLHRQISEAASVSSQLVSHNARGWRTKSHAERDLDIATEQQDRAVAALPKLEALLAQAKQLPNALSTND